MIDISLEEILQKKKEKKEKDTEFIDWNREKESWINAVEKLYHHIEKWLKVYKDKELLDFQYDNIDLEEEDIGKYQIRQMRIKLPDEEVKLTPLGTMLIGAFGRIDLESNSRTIPLILIDKDIDHPVFNIKTSIKGDKIAGNIELGNVTMFPNSSQDEKWKNLAWKIFLKDPNRPIYIPLDKISFLDIFKDIINNV